MIVAKDASVAKIVGIAYIDEHILHGPSVNDLLRKVQGTDAFVKPGFRLARSSKMLFTDT